MFFVRAAFFWSMVSTQLMSKSFGVAEEYAKVGGNWDHTEGIVRRALFIPCTVGKGLAAIQITSFTLAAEVEQELRSLTDFVFLVWAAALDAANFLASV